MPIFLAMSPDIVCLEVHLACLVLQMRDGTLKRKPGDFKVAKSGRQGVFQYTTLRLYNPPPG